MYALFLETEAAQQIDRYAQDKGVDAEEIKRKCYANAREYLTKCYANKIVDGSDGSWDNFWINDCLKDDAHKRWDIDSIMFWFKTPEGHVYWKSIHHWE